MSKKLKLNLEDLKVQSFITALTDEEKNNYKAAGSGADDCNTASCGGVTCTNCNSGCLTCQISWCSGPSACC